MIYFLLKSSQYFEIGYDAVILTIVKKAQCDQLCIMRMPDRKQAAWRQLGAPEESPVV